MKRIMTYAVAALIFLTTPALASGEFRRVADRDTFLQIVEGRSLEIIRPFYLREAINLQVLPDGDIDGQALQRVVDGAWQWREGYFCRDLSWGERNLGPNCQVVAIRGNEIRFIADQGKGRRADFRLQ